MTQGKPENNDLDPTMEEILQSIKRIISDDEQAPDAPAVDKKADKVTAVPAVEDMAAESVIEVADNIPSKTVGTSVETEDVLELTDMVKDDGTIVSLKENNVRDVLDDIDDLTRAIEEAETRIPEEKSLPQIKEQTEEKIPEETTPSVEMLEEVIVEPEPEPENDEMASADELPPVEGEFESEPQEEDFDMASPASEDSGDGTLVSEESATATKDAFKKFIDALPAMRPSKISGEVSTRSGTTIEELLMESMRPLLKDWLDNHLPETVERIVREELQRLLPR